MRVADVHGGFGNGPADQAAPGGPAHIAIAQAIVSDVYGGLGDAVHVHQRYPIERIAVRPLAQIGRLQAVASEDHIAKLAQRGRGLLHLFLDQRVERSRSLIQHRDPVLCNQRAEPRGVANLVFARDDGAPAVQQRPVHLPNRKVEAERVRDHPHVAAMEIEIVTLVLHQPDHVAMGHGAAFGDAGGTRRIDHVRHAVGRENRRLVATIAPGRGDVQSQVAAGVRQSRHKLGPGQNGLRPTIAQHEFHPAGRIAGVERNVGAPGFQNAQDRRDRPLGALQKHGHEIPRANVLPLAQQARDQVRARVQFGVGERDRAAHQRDIAGRRAHLVFKQIGDGLGGRVGGGGRVEALQQRALFGSGDLDKAERAVRSGENAREEVLEITRPAVHGFRGKQARGIREVQAQDVVLFNDVEAQVKHRRRQFDIARGEAQILQLERAAARILIREHGVEDGIAAARTRAAPLGH